MGQGAKKRRPFPDGHVPQQGNLPTSKAIKQTSAPGC